ncbi:zinc finger, C2H2 type family protein (macronuclear) [Tetrahymena thermophila SB210]|uniref:Zinc finger, C2H2 type family protein n=1 Tax=Tetrahymena thermophila (strain SB210) TaxID=312017 RepID=I7MIM9_TETTS|nr:zinc finger, C2H2 type family protein [Tetrahymena thermophila SB210]EAR93864.1 zinc finger, C2H2 type family protein [Tetrahymena thermophila SB210]|eukprot:XP_001014109.1 zinc finger, C2H2 type family protein [Tetrahymena thermophila SB210]
MSQFNFDSQTQGIESYSKDVQQDQELSDISFCPKKLEQRYLNLYSSNHSSQSTASYSLNDLPIQYYENNESARQQQICGGFSSSESNQNSLSEGQYQKSILSQRSESIECVSNLQNNQLQEQNQNSTFRCFKDNDQNKYSNCNVDNCICQLFYILDVTKPNSFIFGGEQNSMEEFTDQQNQQIGSENQHQQIQINPTQIFNQPLKDNQPQYEKSSLNQNQMIFKETQVQQPSQLKKWKWSAAKLRAKEKNKFAYTDSNSCNECKLRYANLGALINHVKREHKGEETSKFQMKRNTTKGRPPKQKNNLSTHKN